MATINSLFEAYSIYEYTTILLGTESLIMGATLLAIRHSIKKSRIYGKSVFSFLAIAMFVLCIVNFAEYIIADGSEGRYSLAIAIFAVSMEMFLLFFVYIFLTRNKDVFDRTISAMDGRETEIPETPLSQPESCPRKVDGFISSRQKYLDDWIDSKGYSVAGVTANEVAARLNTNRSRLSQYLKNDLHTNYYQWIASMRIEDAKKQLIEYPDRSIYEIAFSVGIEDRDNFRRIFQRYVGMSPSAYRKKHLEKSV